MDKIEREIIEALKSLKDDPAYGGGFDFAATHAKALKRNGFNSDVASRQYTWRDYLETYTWQFTHSMLRPLGAAVAIFVFAITGFISVANASSRALPGDELYSVKLGIEKVQLALAFRADSRANLQVEFASRRLEEMVEVSALLHENTPETVQVAVDRFKSEVTSIKEELQEETGTQEKKTELAKAVGRKTEAYSSAVASSAGDLSPEVRGEVTEIIEETKDQAVEVIITAHEETPDEDTERELSLALEDEIENVKRQFAGASAQAVENALALQAEGNYRRAFQVLKEFTLAHESEVLP
ncbi:hypothetical protein HZA87_00650 [Candidatus Uhrbacteria bacterium]|nr:hypothetical protein [Candidatus Uhrbacteria bacterium]